VIDSASVASCIVSYLNIEGLRHEVEAESLYEAATLASETFRKHNCEPGVMGKLEVEVRSSVTLTLTVQRLQNWLNDGAKSPKEAVTKERLRELL